MADSLSLELIAELTSGSIAQGDSTGTFSGLNALNEATSSDISFLGNPKYVSDFQATRAGAALVTKEAIPLAPPTISLVVVENPTLAFGAIIDHFRKDLAKPDPGIHPTAVVHASATLGKDVTVGPNVVIEEHVHIGDRTILGPGTVISSNSTIGKDCQLGSNVNVTQRSRIGSRVTIHPGVVVGSDGFGYEVVNGALKKIDQLGIVAIEDDVEIGANTTIDRARFGETLIGTGTKIDNLVQIGHNVRIGKNCIVVAQAGIAGSTTLKDNVTVAAQSGVAGHLVLEEGFQLAAKSGLLKSGPAGQAYMGKPARPIRQQLKSDAYVARLPKLIARVKALEEAADE